MVLEDPFREHNRPRARSSGGDPHQRLADPMERLAAFVLDFLFILPAANFFSIPIYQEFFRARLYGQTAFVIYYGLLSLLITFGLFILYQTICIPLWQGTPGKRLLGLKVVSVSGAGRVDWLASLQRSLLVALEASVLFIPLFSLFSHDRRRPLHDRAAETMVISLSGRHISSPHQFERRFAKILAPGFTILIMLILLVALLGALRSESGPLDSYSHLCTPVNKARQDWPLQEARIETAMALYAAGAIEEDCLDQEADFALWKDEAPEVAYLAKAFTTASEGAISNRYLEKVCESEVATQACRLSQLVESRAFDRSGKRLASLGIGDEDKIFLRVWGIRFHWNLGNYAEALGLLDSLLMKASLGDFVTRYRTQALVLLGREREGGESLFTAVNHLEGESRWQLLSWYCERGEVGDCSGARSRACGWLADGALEKLSESSNQQWLLRLASAQYCLRQEDLELAKSRVQDPLTRDFLTAFEAYRRGESRETSRMRFHRLTLEAYGQDHEMEFESAKWWVRLSDTSSEFKDADGFWSRAKPGETGWAELGEDLAKKYFEVGLRERSQEIARKVYSNDPQRFDAGRIVVIGLWERGREEDAWEIARQFPPQVRSPAREPAAESSSLNAKYSVIFETLKKRYRRR